uniref:Uncharacterized protein n=1 Tax=Oryza brachyantha TaxID=4533 RepID=J3NDR9_ORYBR
MDDAVEVPEINTFVRLPTYMREAHRGLFEPRVVSIGPYHSGKESTLDMEAHKDHVLHHGFFQRPGNANHAYYVQEVTNRCFAQARRCYAGGAVDDYTVEMLTRDGCFVAPPRILDNLLSDEDEVASFFNELGRCAMVDVRKHRYTGMFRDVNRTPLACLSLMAAVLLLSFSCISMVFAVLKYTRG